MDIFDTVPRWILSLAFIGVLAIIAGIVVFIYEYRRRKNTDKGQDRIARAIDLVWSERNRQIHEEGFTYENDDQYKNDELAIAASCYLVCPTYAMNNAIGITAPRKWPLHTGFWRPQGGRIRQLVKANALALAELERELRKREKDPDYEKYN